LKYRFVIALMVFALMAMPCAKIATAYAGASAQASASAVAQPDSPSEDALANGLELLVASDIDDSQPVCHKSCKQWQGVVPRADDIASPAARTLVVVAILSHDVVTPNGGMERSASGARSPPEPAGATFDLFYAKTSRFLS
jgi:hypothetical protein